MESQEDPRHCRWLAKGQMRRMVGLQDEENKPAHTTRGSWLDGGDVQETKCYSRTWSDWATLVIDGTTGYNTINPASSLVQLGPGVMRVYHGRVNDCRPHTLADVCG